MKTQPIDLYRYQRGMRALQIFLNIITAGLFQFLMNKSNFRRLFLFKKATPENFDHVEVKSKQSITNKFSPVDEHAICVNNKLIQAKTFIFNKKRYYINPDNCREAIRIKFKLEKMLHNQILSAHSTGIEESKISILKSTYGPNKMDFKIPSIFQILKQEIFSFVYYFQIFSIIIWFLDDYAYFCILLIFMTSLSLYFIVRETQAQLRKVREKLMASGHVTVRRIVEEVERTSQTGSEDLYPGDLIIIEPGSIIQADIVLLKGSCLVNEAMLSGESRLIQKNPINNDREKFRKIDSTSILFAGSKCEEIFDEEIYGVVWRTGFETMNGKMIKSVLSPKFEKCQMENDLSRFLIIMVIFGLFGWLSYFIFYFAAKPKDVSPFKMVMRCFELVTTLVPAFLPLCLAQSNYYGMKRIEKLKIVCSSHYQLNISGSVKSMFFDKTGTITENDLSLKNYIEFNRNGGLVSVKPTDFSVLNDHYKTIIATCHTLCKIISFCQKRD